MQKSRQRIRIETRIRNMHDESLNIALRMVDEEFDGNLEAALSDEQFVRRMQGRVRRKWTSYRNAYRRLEELEKEEGYTAMHKYAAQLDLLAEHMPVRKTCYYPFSGVDFYWARIFDHVVFEDIAFDKEEEIPNMWWDLETYGPERRAEIISTMKTQGIIPASARMEFVSGDAEVQRYDKLNHSESTLVIKGGHDVIEYIGRRFPDNFGYGAVISVGSINALEDMKTYLADRRYSMEFSLEGADFVPPYAMELRDAHVFLKK